MDHECPICGAPTEWESCWQCDGAGGWHNCGDDTCPCADPHEITDVCNLCGGHGSYRECTSLPHTIEQMARYWASIPEAPIDTTEPF